MRVVTLSGLGSLCKWQDPPRRGVRGFGAFGMGNMTGEEVALQDQPKTYLAPGSVPGPDAINWTHVGVGVGVGAVVGATLMHLVRGR